VVIATEWNQFRKLDLDRLRKLVKTTLVIDLRNLYEPEEMTAEGFRYVSIGRPEGVPDAKPQTVDVAGARS
jgi:UDPglucose 6-dehydrogenase